MKKLVLSLCVATALFSCSNDDNDGLIINTGNQVTAPDTYVFERNGNSSVSFSGQTDRIKMSEEILSAFTNTAKTELEIKAMFDHQTGNSDFTDTALNSSSKNVRSKVAASRDFFSANTTASAAIKADFEGFISDQVNNVFPNWANTASMGNAGQLQQAGGGSIRYINAKGLEYNQAFAKSLLGALMTDQILNNYLSDAVLDEAQNIANNNNGVLDGTSNYTTMEHKWDEAFGYLYGKEPNPAMPTLEHDKFLNEYLAKADQDTDFNGIAMTVFNAFKLGRAAIVAKNYTVRDQQVEIIREKLSEVIAIRAVYYLQQGKAKLTTDKASAFHALSEAYGFIYSLQFTRKPGSTEAYFTKTEVEALNATLMSGNGFWDITGAELDTISNTISDEFTFTTAQAGN